MHHRRFVTEALTALGLIGAPFVLPHLGFAPNTVNQILVWGLFGIGFDLLFGYTGLLSFGQSAFYGTGGFVAAYLLTNNLMSDVLTALVVGTIGAALAGIVVGVIALRRTGIYFAMITVAIAETFFFVENSPLSAWTGGENGLPGVPTPRFAFGGFVYQVGTGWSMYGFLAACYFIGIVIALRIVRSPVGAILTAIRDNPLRARAVGHAIGRYKLTAFVIAAAYAGFAGGLLGVLQGFMPPDAFTFDTSGQLVMQTAIGGLGTLFGPLLGAMVWLYLRDLLQAVVGLGSAWKLVLGLVFVLLVCFLRRGLIGGVRDLLARFTAPAQPPAPVAAGAGALAPLSSIGPARRRRTTKFSGPALEARGLTKSFGGLVANRDIDFAVDEGELRGIIGPNGAGKSTFFKMLTCELPPSAGRIIFNGRDITGMNVARVCQLGLTKSYQVNQLFTRLTVRENVVIAALGERRGTFRLDLLRRIDRVAGLDTQVESTLALVGLGERPDVPVAQLAYGEKRRLEIATGACRLAVAAAVGRTAGRDEPCRAGRDRAASQKHPARAHLGGGRARHGRSLRIGRTDHRLARRGAARRGRAIRDPAQQPGAGGLSRRGGGGVSALLEAERINSYYGDSHILFDVSLRVEKNEVVGLLGRNGAGKSTTLKSLIGVVRPRSGRIIFDGTPTHGLPAHAIAALGVQLVPEERRIFGSLSVEDNLVLAALTAKSRWPVERVWETFPRLRERRKSRGTDLSGGEQQMLAIARALVREPKILLLDEPFEGLAPIIVRDLLATCRALAQSGQTIVLVEQNISAALSLSDRVYVLNNGHIVDEMTAQTARSQPEAMHRYLGV